MHTYTGITTDMKKRQKQHDEGLCRTTHKMNKSYGLPKDIFYRKIENESYEKIFKKYSNYKKLQLINSNYASAAIKGHSFLNWMRWAG